jgi:CRISPR/Cas system-associated exonuclease Cas4 (RecB family)
MSEREGKISGSGMSAYAACPGRFNLESTMPEGESSPYADMGTRIHEYIATGEGKLNDDEVDIAERCVAGHTEAVATINAGEITSVTKEERFWFCDLYSGQIDRIDHIGEEIAIVTDYKTGRIAQSNANENLQLRAYAVLVKENFPKLKKIYACIIQPMAGPMTIAEYDEDALLEAKSQIYAIVTRAYSPNAPRIPSPDACKYCRAKSVCPEAGGKVRTLAKNSVESILALTDDQLAEYNDAADIAESVIEAIRSETRKRLNNGAEIRGWELKAGRGSRTIDNAEDAFGKLSYAGVLDAAEFAQCCKVSVSQLEKAVVRNLKLKAKDGKEKLALLLGDVLTTKQGEPVMSRKK